MSWPLGDPVFEETYVISGTIIY